MDNIVLTKNEIVQITGKKQCSAQAAQLRALLIDFKTRADGSLLVFRQQIEVGQNTSNRRRIPAQDFSAI